MNFLGFLGIVFVAFCCRKVIREKIENPNRSKVLPVPPYYKELLEKYFFYYQKLSPANKHKFEQKLCYFIAEKEFFPREMAEVSQEMIVLISAVAVQITFGLPNVFLSHFKTILVYPNHYLSRITRRYHEGEVNPALGIIVLSWEDVAKGVIYDKNGFNLGLHEMAHALRIGNYMRQGERHFFDATLLEKADEWAQKISQKADDNFFRAYAFTNTHEFFAVAIESFFERSEAFQTKYPELYHVIAQLLNQDPLLLSEVQKSK